MAKSKEYELAIKIAGQIEKSFYNSTKLTRKELASIAREASRSSNTIHTSLSQSLKKGLNDAAPVFAGIEKAGKVAFEKIATVATTAATAVAAVTAASISVGASFEAQMSTVQAISGASGEDLEKLNNLAKELGATTQFTATQAGEAMEYMAMAGWKTNDMLAGMEGVLNLAAASGEDLGMTSDIVTDAMTAFGMGANEVDRFADVLAAASTNSNTNVSMMGETFTYAASAAGALGYSIEDVSLAIGLMANSGIKASQAGTALRRMLVETTNGATVVSKALGGEFTIETQNEDGSMRELKDIIVDLREAFSTMTEAEKAMNAESISGKTGMSGLLAVVNASETDFNKLSEAIINSKGAAKEMAEIRLDNLTGDVTIMKSALEGLGIQIYEDLSNPLRIGVQWVTEMVGVLSKKMSKSGIIANITEQIPTFVRRMKEAGKAVGDFAKPFLEVGGWLLDNPGVLAGAFASIGTAIMTYKVASGITSVVTALGGLGPVGWTILAIGGVVGVIAGIGTAIKKSATEAKKANLDAHFGNISLSLEELNEAAAHIVSTDNLGKVREALSAFAELDEVQQAIDDSMREINKMNWKLSIGMELSVEEKNQYQNEMKEYIESCQQYINDNQYAVNLAVGVMTDDDLEGSNIVAQVNQFYSDKQKELADLGTKLNTAITDAFKDGLLDMDEVEEITQLQEQMARIQSAVAGKNFESNLELLQMKYGGMLDAESFENFQAEIGEQVKAAVDDYDKSYVLSASNAKIMFDEGKINAEEYNAMLAEYKENYLEQIGELEVKATGFQMDTIMNQYSDELNAAIPYFQGETEKIMSNAFSDVNLYGWESNAAGMFSMLYSSIKDASNLDSATKDALSELYEKLKPSAEELEAFSQQCREMGEAIPEAVRQELLRINQLGSMLGDEDAIWNMVGESIVGNEDYENLINNLSEDGAYIPESIAQAISDNKIVVETAIKDLHNATEEIIDSTFGKGFNISTMVHMNLKPVLDASAISKDNPLNNLNGHAKGGIFDKPHIAWFAEEGPEAAIPLDGSQNAINLWEQTGKLLGINGFSNDESFSSMSDKLTGQTSTSSASAGENSTSISYSPTLQFYGEAPTKQDLEGAMQLSQERFEQMMKQYIKDNGRISFA